MKKLLLGALFVIFISAAISAQSQSSVRIVNNTGEIIYFVYISPLESDNWGEDVLGGEILESGQTATVPLPHSSDNTYDVKLEATYDYYTKYKITVSNNARIVFTLDDLGETGN
jgi:hypothetical protein